MYANNKIFVLEFLLKTNLHSTNVNALKFGGKNPTERGFI